MIYGPYSTGWRSERARRERLARAARRALGVWLLAVASVAFWAWVVG